MIMATRLTYEFVKSEIESTNKYFLIGGEYKNNQSKLLITDKDDYKYLYGFSHVIHHVKGNGTGLEAFNVSNLYSIENIQLWLYNNKPQIKLISGKYIGAYDNNLLFYCERCEDEFNSSWNNISNKKVYGCLICSSKIPSHKNNLETCFPKLLCEWDYEENGDPKDYLPHSNLKVKWICSKCENPFEAIINDRTTSGNGCSICSQSKGESSIRDFLILNNIDFNPEHTFPKCRNKKELPFDFYIYGYDQEIVIEYDGILHYKDKFNNPEEFEKTKLRDKIKTKYCKDNNIYLLRIPYWDFDNIEQILTETLFS